MGGKFPNHSFTLMVWGKDLHKYDTPLQDLSNQLIATTAKVNLYKSRVQITIRKPRYIEILEL